MRIRLVKGDITGFDADAIVNAANTHLLPGGGVSGAIHAAGGPEVAREGAAWVREHGVVQTGAAAITTGGHLPARHVIHAVGPVWHGGNSGEPGLLASAYRHSIELADANRLETIAFPSISTGIFGYPADRAAPVALRAVRDALATAAHVREVIFVLYDQDTYAAYQKALQDMGDE
jgi:O-acetyl-ADP-ribose deacetylase (regulator of RNase III)